MGLLRFGDAPALFEGLDFGVGIWGSRFGVRSWGFGAEVVVFGVWGSVFGVWGLGCGVWGVGVWCLMFAVPRAKIQSFSV